MATEARSGQHLHRRNGWANPFDAIRKRLEHPTAAAARYGDGVEDVELRLAEIDWLRAIHGATANAHEQRVDIDELHETRRIGRWLYDHLSPCVRLFLGDVSEWPWLLDPHPDDAIHHTEPLAQERDGRLAVIRGVPYAETQDGHHFNPLTASIVVEAFEQLLNTDNQVTICSWVNVRADALARRLRPEDAE